MRIQCKLNHLTTQLGKVSKAPQQVQNLQIEKGTQVKKRASGLNRRQKYTNRNYTHCKLICGKSLWLHKNHSIIMYMYMYVCVPWRQSCPVCRLYQSCQSVLEVSLCTGQRPSPSSERFTVNLNCIQIQRKYKYLPEI